MNKNKIKGIIAIAGFFMLMMTAASVNADDEEIGILDREVINYEDNGDIIYDDTVSGDEPNLISPNPDDGDLGPLIIAQDDTIGTNDDSSGIFTSNFKFSFLICSV